MQACVYASVGTCVSELLTCLCAYLSFWTWQGDVIWDMQQMQEVIETEIQVCGGGGRRERGEGGKGAGARGRVEMRRRNRLRERGLNVSLSLLPSLPLSLALPFPTLILASVLYTLYL